MHDGWMKYAKVDGCFFTRGGALKEPFGPVSHHIKTPLHKPIRPFNTADSFLKFVLHMRTTGCYFKEINKVN